MTTVTTERNIESIDQAFDAAVRSHYEKLRRLAEKIVSDAGEADDVVQTALIAAWRNFGSFEGRSSVGTWLHAIVVNSARRFRSRAAIRAGREVVVPIGTAEVSGVAEPADECQVAEARAERGETRSMLATALRQLTPDHRRVLVLRDLRGLDSAEAAAQLGIDEGLVRVRLHRARARLRQAV